MVYVCVCVSGGSRGKIHSLPHPVWPHSLPPTFLGSWSSCSIFKANNVGPSLLNPPSLWFWIFFFPLSILKYSYDYIRSWSTIVSLFYSNLIPSATFTNPGIFTGPKDTFTGHYSACHTSYDFCSLRLLGDTCRSQHFMHSVLFDLKAPRQAEF